MFSFLMSEVGGVRITENPKSNAPHDRLEFRGIVRGCQPEERQKWISDLLEGKGRQRDCRDEDIIEMSRRG